MSNNYHSHIVRFPAQNPIQCEQSTNHAIHALLAGGQVQPCKHLPHELLLIAPQNADIPGIVKLLCEECGGTTDTDARGNYIGFTGKNIAEEVVAITTYCTYAELMRVLPKLKHVILQILTELKEETVFLAIDGKAVLLELASPESKAA